LEGGDRRLIEVLSQRFPTGMTKPGKTSHDSRCPGRSSNQAPPVYKSRALALLESREGNTFVWKACGSFHWAGWCSGKALHLYLGSSLGWNNGVIDWGVSWVSSFTPEKFLGQNHDRLLPNTFQSITDQSPWHSTLQKHRYWRRRKTDNKRMSTIFWDITPCSPLRVSRSFGGTCSLHLQGQKGRYVPPKLWLTLNGLHDVISQKMVFFIITAVRTSNPTAKE
jgi:hypothetical protein